MGTGRTDYVAHEENVAVGEEGAVHIEEGAVKEVAEEQLIKLFDGAVMSSDDSQETDTSETKTNSVISPFSVVESESDSEVYQIKREMSVSAMSTETANSIQPRETVELYTSLTDSAHLRNILKFDRATNHKADCRVLSQVQKILISSDTETHHSRLALLRLCQREAQ
jgi:hypothetical protein